MSYLDTPRIHFIARFLADPSTINNNKPNFDPATVLVDPKTPSATDGVAWNPFGGHAFKIGGGVVSRAINSTGAVSGTDPVVGGLLVSTDSPYPAKMVDLDPDQPSISQVIGLKIRVSLADGTPLLTGTAQTTGLVDLWFRVAGSPSAGSSRESLSAAYQTVLTDLTWAHPLPSPVLATLKAASPGLLSLRYVLDGYQWLSTAPDFTQGRIVGTIGPVRAGEPTRFVAGRRIIGLNQPFHLAANAFVDPVRSTLTIDLGNALATTSLGGPVVPGAIQVAVQDTAAHFAAINSMGMATGSTGATPGNSVLGTVNVTTSTYTEAAGVVELPLNPAQLALVANHPLVMTSSNGSTLASEDASGLYVDVETPALRMNPYDIADVRALALRWGQPIPSYNLNLQLIPNPCNNDPPGALVFPSSVMTDATGWATIPLTAQDPSPKPACRQFVEGQVYFLGGDWTSPGNSAQISGGGAISVRIFDTYSPPPHPTWADVQPIFASYARLYPGMTSILDLSDYAAIKPYGNAIASKLSLKEDDPHYMPVMRELSAAKKDMIVKWINNGMPK